MNSNFICPALFLFIFFIQTPVTFTQSNGSSEYAACGEPFSCANIENIGYPFWGGSRPAYCGHPVFELNCRNQSPKITIRSVEYKVVSISNQTATIVRDDLLSNICPQNPQNASLDFNLFTYVSSGNQNITLFYGCTLILPVQVPIPNLFNCSEDSSNSNSRGLWSPIPGLPNIPGISNIIKCGIKIFVTVSQGVLETSLRTSLASKDLVTTSISSGFSVEWKANNGLCADCMSSGGLCGSNVTNSTEFVCYCANGTFSSTCGDTAGNDNNVAGVLPFNIVLLLLFDCFFFFF